LVGKANAKILSFKNLHIKLDLLLPRGQNPLSILYNESKHNILALVGKANKKKVTDGRTQVLANEESPKEGLRDFLRSWQCDLCPRRI
jgi:hypothetical protein